MSETDHSQLTRAEVRSATDTDKLSIASLVTREHNNNTNNRERAIILLDHIWPLLLSEELKLMKGFIGY